MSSAPGARADLFFFPIRHHSPACSNALNVALAEIRPAQILVEAPLDFAFLLPVLTDPRTKPPIAIVSLPPDTKDKAGTIATYPFCAHSPEYVALRWAREMDVRSTLIDLPARHPDMQKRFGDVPGPTPLIEDWRLDHNAYVTELCSRRGVRDGAALWDALFESQGGTGDWRGFFATVGAYCSHIRTVTLDVEIEGDGTLMREACMVAHLQQALEDAGPIAIVTGGFHTSALRAAIAANEPAAAVPPAPKQKAYLVRYGFRQLDRAIGYGAGLPHPAWYDRFWQTLQSGARPDAMTPELLVAFADHLRTTAPQLALATPTVTAACVSADRLASLRELPWPGRTEIIDALRSAGVKDAMEMGTSSLVAAFDTFLVGDAIGDLPPGAAQPPIVDAVRSSARALGFNLETGQIRTRDLDFLRRPQHTLASQFLFALDFLDTQFARRVSGPDLLSGWRGEAMFESWTYAWSPLVESRLIGRAADGDTLEATCSAELVRRRELLLGEGRSRSTSAMAELLVAVARTGIAALTERAVDWCNEAVIEDPEASSVIRALAIASALAANARTDQAAAFGALRRHGFARLLLLFPHLADTPPARLPDLIRSLADLAALLGDAESAMDRSAVAELLATLLSGPLPPALNGALLAFAGLIGAMPEEAVADRIAVAMEGAYLNYGDRVAALTGCLAVSPRLLVRSSALAAATDRFLAAIDSETFLSVLPELRLALGHLSPNDIDRVAEWVATRHGLQVAEVTTADATDAETAENLVLTQTLEANWRRDGLAQWMELAS